jgi:AcrR family transcriptional regulator
VRRAALPRWKNTLQTSTEVQKIKREAVLREAGRAFSRFGYHNTSLDDVARILQVSKGTLYNYVKDKQEILMECHRVSIAIEDRAFAFAEEKGGTGAEFLRNVLSHFIRLLTEELGACAILMEVDALRPEDRTEVVEHRKKFVRRFVAAIQRGIKDGSIRTVDPKLVVFTFMGAINWMSRWYEPTGRLSGIQIADSMTDLLLAGLLSANAKASVAPEGKAKSSRTVKKVIAATSPPAKKR